jgi:hypothetical protein
MRIPNHNQTLRQHLHIALTALIIVHIGRIQGDPEFYCLFGCPLLHKQEAYILYFLYRI